MTVKELREEFMDFKNNEFKHLKYLVWALIFKVFAILVGVIFLLARK